MFKTLFNFPKRLISIFRVCKKYNLKFLWLDSIFNKRAGFIGWNVGLDSDYTLLAVYIFHNNFWEILFHEIGHLVAKRSLNFQVKHCEASKTEYRWGHINALLLIEEEATASKFAQRMLKKKSAFLERCWYSYTENIKNLLVCLDSDTEYHMQYIDVVAKNYRIFHRSEDVYKGNQL